MAYVNTDELLEELQEELDYEPPFHTLEQIEWFNKGLKCAVRAVERQPTADVAEVKHGEWKDKFNRSRMVTQSFCSVCGEHSGVGGIESNRHKPYCPNCGAKMDGGKAE